MILKFLLFLFLFFFVFIRLGGLLMRIFFGSLGANRTARNFSDTQSSSRKKPKDGNVNIDFVPKKKGSQKGNIKGGDYVDYEEVK